MYFVILFSRVSFVFQYYISTRNEVILISVDSDMTVVLTLLIRYNYYNRLVI